MEFVLTDYKADYWGMYLLVSTYYLLEWDTWL